MTTNLLIEQGNVAQRLPGVVLDEIVYRILGVVQPKKIILFGSAARGQMTPDSDLDVLVIVPAPAHRRKLAQAIYRNLHGVSLPVDVIVVTDQDVFLHADQVGSILLPALREGKTIYENKQ